MLYRFCAFIYQIFKPLIEAYIRLLEPWDDLLLDCINDITIVLNETKSTNFPKGCYEWKTLLNYLLCYKAMQEMDFVNSIFHLSIVKEYYYYIIMIHKNKKK